MKSKNNDSDLFTIGTIAKSFGVSDNTIRRMESAGLLTPAVVRESGYRYYDYANISRIKLILTLKSFGLVNKDIREFFKNPGDFTPVYDKLYEKKLALDALLDRARLHLRPDNPDEIFLVPHKSIPFFVKRCEVSSLNDIDVIEEISAAALRDAVLGQYPVDYTRPIVLETYCMDFSGYDPAAPQEMKVMVPLRRIIKAPDTYLMPSRKVLSVAYYRGLSIGAVLEELRKHMAENGLKQISPLAGTFEIGQYLDSGIDKNNYLFHIMIPCGEI